MEINKIIAHDHTIKNDIILSINNGIITHFVEKKFIIKTWIMINKIESGVKNRFFLRTKSITKKTFSCKYKRK